jgi:hypothetical protein
MNRVNRLSAVVVLGAVIAVVGTCAKEENLSLPNLPPETYVAIADSVRNPTVYTQTVVWWGDDSDGEVVGFEYRWSTDPSQGGCGFDTSWVYTEERSKSFNLPVTDSMSTHTLKVRAKDNDGALDPTPSTLTLPVTNSAPEVTILDRKDLPDTTFPAITVAWHGDDPEGNETIDHYLLWLDGQEASPLVVSAGDTMASFGPTDFGGDVERERTLNLVAVDTGCDTSEVVTYSWYVKGAEDVLVIDDISSTSPAELLTDMFYRGALNSCVGAYSLLDIEAFDTDAYGGGEHIPPYSLNFSGLFESFDLVVWYNAPLFIDTLYLMEASEAIVDFVDSGGEFLLVSNSAVGWRAAFSDSVGFEFFGIDSLYKREGKSNFDCLQTWQIEGNSSVGLGNLNPTGNYKGAECMCPSAGASWLYRIPPGTVDELQTTDYYIGVMNSWGSGKVALLTFPISGSNRYGNADDDLCTIIDLLRQ